MSISLRSSYTMSFMREHYHYLLLLHLSTVWFIEVVMYGFVLFYLRTELTSLIALHCHIHEGDQRKTKYAVDVMKSK